jgi:hypothetical protein
MKLIDKVKDTWLTHRTGMNKADRDYKAWYDANVNWRASDITDMFKNFEHVIEVNPNKFLWDGGLSWVPHPKAKQYFWPERELGKNAVWRFERVVWDKWDQRWHINGLGGEDRVFVATNNEKDAIMIALQWA